MNEVDAKIVLLGNSGTCMVCFIYFIWCGKNQVFWKQFNLYSSLVLRYVQGTYSTEQSSTIGASFMTKRVFLDDWKLKLQASLIYGVNISRYGILQVKKDLNQ